MKSYMPIVSLVVLGSLCGPLRAEDDAWLDSLSSWEGDEGSLVAAEEKESWWSRLTPDPPHLSMPTTPLWLRKMNQGTKRMIYKTKRTLTAPFRRSSSDSSRAGRKSAQQPGFMARLFGASEPAQRPQTVNDFLQLPRPGMQ